MLNTKLWNNLCSMCILSAVTRLGCLFWVVNALFEVMHMWCDSLYLCAALFTWAEHCGKAPHGASSAQLSSVLWLSSYWKPGGRRVSTRGKRRPLLQEQSADGELHAGRTLLPNFKLNAQQLVKCWVVKDAWCGLIASTQLNCTVSALFEHWAVWINTNRSSLHI